MNQKEQLELLLHWARNTKRAQFGHYRMSNSCRNRFTVIGVTVTIIAGIGGSAFLVNLQRLCPAYATEISIGIGLLLLSAALLSAIQTLLRLDERAQKHLTAAAKYGSVKRHVDQLVASARSSPIDPAIFTDIRQSLDGLATECPQIPDKLLTKIEKTMPPTPFEQYYPRSLEEEKQDE